MKHVHPFFKRPERETTIYTNGCYGELVIEELINDLLPLLSGIILGIIIFEVIIAGGGT